MISFCVFENAKKLKASSFREGFSLLQAEKKKAPKAPIILELDVQEEEGEYLFPFSYVYFHVTRGCLFTKHYANELDEEGKERTTWKTAALKITGEHNIFEGLEVRNIAGDPKTKGQEVAVGIYAGDNLFLHCHFVSTQDTLFVGPLPDDLCTRYRGFIPENERYYEGNCRNYFVECIVEGSVDFIFGAGQAIFDRCRFITVDDSRSTTWVVAPSHSLKDPFGYLFYECAFAKGEGVRKGSIYLARPWRDYGKAVFASCTYEDHISPLGFDDWNAMGRDKTARFEEYPLRDGRVPWMKNKKGSTLPKEYEASILELREAYLVK